MVWPYTDRAGSASPIAARTGMVSASSLIETLSPRERECLRLVAEGLTSKQIAGRLVPGGDGAGARLSAHTVDGYIKTAVGKLGAADRKSAARQLAEHEGRDPRWLGDQPPGVEVNAVEAPPAAPATSPGQSSFPWPWRRPGELDNNLSVSMRLIWILVLAIAIAVGFGSLSSGLKVIADLVGSQPLLRH